MLASLGRKLTYCMTTPWKRARHILLCAVAAWLDVQVPTAYGKILEKDDPMDASSLLHVLQVIALDGCHTLKSDRAEATGVLTEGNS